MNEQNIKIRINGLSGYWKTKITQDLTTFLLAQGATIVARDTDDTCCWVLHYRLSQPQKPMLDTSGFFSKKEQQ